MGSLLLLLGCSEPFVMIPGGRLSGTTQPVPESWRFTDAHEDVQLETRPADPYSVNVWVVAVGDDLFVASGRGAESAWARHIAADPNVRLRVGDDIYELRAVEADTKLDRRRFTAALSRKYDDYEPDEEESARAILYRLEPR
jgi:hypothetical protein